MTTQPNPPIGIGNLRPSDLRRPKRRRKAKVGPPETYSGRVQRFQQSASSWAHTVTLADIRAAMKRVGPEPEAIAADLARRGIETSAEQVARMLARAGT